MEDRPATQHHGSSQSVPVSASSVRPGSGTEPPDGIPAQTTTSDPAGTPSNSPTAVRTAGPSRPEAVYIPTAASSPPTSPVPGRKSIQLPPPKKTVRRSEEFDRRYNGPYGRPSLTMTRRRSSGVSRGTSPQRPATARVARDTADVEKAEADEEGRRAAAAGEPGFQPEPPRLNYTLRTRKLSIAFFWSLILIDSVAMPIGLYFGLWYGVGPGSSKATLSANVVFSIVTAAIGGASIIEYFLRFWRLWRKGSTCRVLGAHRWYLDWFHWNFSLAWIIIMVELIVGTIPSNPPIRLLSMPLTTMLFAFGTELLLVDTLRLFRVPAPVRVSSVPKGAQLRPCLYSLIEDICAVDGSGGTEFREALNRRYESSHIFRVMLRRLGIFWAVGAEGMAVVCTILIFTLESNAAYIIGWSAPFGWAAVWTLLTFWYVNRELKRETKEWCKEVATGNSPRRESPTKDRIFHFRRG